MATSSNDIQTWSRPLLTWVEVFIVPLVMMAQLIVFLILCFVPTTALFRPPPPGQAVGLLVLNGLVGVPVFFWCCLKWLAVKKYARWSVSCDSSGIKLTTHKNVAHQVPWSKFKGYIIAFSPKKQVRILSDDGALDFDVPFLGFHDIHETTHRLLMAMDTHVPVVFFVSLRNRVETKRQQSQDSVLPDGVGSLVRSFPSSKSSSKAFQIVIAGFLLFILFTIMAMRRDPQSYGMGCLMIGATVCLFVASQRQLNIANRRVMVTSTHFIVRQGNKQWVIPRAASSIALETRKGRFSQRVRRVEIRYANTELTLLEQWSEGDWLSRSLRSDEAFGSTKLSL